MLGIGEFSHSTGMSIKTLRYYDEIGLLRAAEVDPHNGYRSYRASQIREAALLRVLRASGMGIAQMKQALTHPQELTEILEQRAQELAAQRALEDWALTEAPNWQQPVDPSQVQTRQCDPQHWAGVETKLDLNDMGDDADDAVMEAKGDLMEEQVTQLGHALGERGIALVPGAFWLNLSSDRKNPTVIRMAYCVQTTAPVPSDFSLEGATVVSGLLPRREEGFATTTIDPDAVDDHPANSLPGGPLPHPTGIALTMMAEQAGIQDEPVRQRMVITETGPVIEHAVTIAVR